MTRSLLALVFSGLLMGGCAPAEEAPKPAADDAAESVRFPDPENPDGQPEQQVPEGWLWRFDRGQDFTVGAVDTLDTWFVTMTPGWHITTKPAGIFYHPGASAQGSFTASTKIHLFDPGTRNEGYGLILGGSNLDGPEQRYLYFLLRKSGEYLVKLRDGEETTELIGWTQDDAVAAWTEESEGTITNTLAVTVGPETLSFLVNGEEVASLEKGDIPTDGIVGLRMNHSVNVHVSEFGVTTPD